MINAISSNMPVTISSTLQVAVNNVSVTSESGFTKQGLALLALLSILDTKDNPLNLAQRIILFNLLSSRTVNIDNFNISALDGSISSVSYTSTGSAIPQTASTGSLYNTVV